MNHYHVKTYEEYVNTKMQRGWPCGWENPYSEEKFKVHDRNEIFDDGILKYRAARAENFSLENEEQKFKRVTAALTKILSAYASGQTFSLETALTCRALSTYLREKFPDDDARWKIYEEASLAAIVKSLLGEVNHAQARLLIRDLPNLLRFPYPVVKEIRQEVLRLIGQLMQTYHQTLRWKDFVDFEYLQDLLKNFRE